LRVVGGYFQSEPRVGEGKGEGDSPHRGEREKQGRNRKTGTKEKSPSCFPPEEVFGQSIGGGGGNFNDIVEERGIREGMERKRSL